MRLRTKLPAGILAILLLQVAVTGVFTLTTFLSRTRGSTERELDWHRVRLYMEELKHTLYTEIFELRFILKDGPAGPDPENYMRDSIRHYMSMTEADRVLLVDGEGNLIADEWAGVSRSASLSPKAIDPRQFRFPRNQSVGAGGPDASMELFLVTGTALRLGGSGLYHLYLVSNIDKRLIDRLFEKTGTVNAFFVGNRFVASNASEFALDNRDPPIPHGPHRQRPL